MSVDYSPEAVLRAQKKCVSNVVLQTVFKLLVGRYNPNAIIMTTVITFDEIVQKSGEKDCSLKGLEDVFEKHGWGVQKDYDRGCYYFWVPVTHKPEL
jgi:hypothetical protein